MNLEGLDCWDDYPMEHGCICGNDCPPPPLPLDPLPWTDGETRSVKWFGAYLPIGQFTAYFDPRPGYSQNKEDYA